MNTEGRRQIFLPLRTKGAFAVRFKIGALGVQYPLQDAEETRFSLINNFEALHQRAKTVILLIRQQSPPAERGDFPVVDFVEPRLQCGEAKRISNPDPSRITSEITRQTFRSSAGAQHQPGRVPTLPGDSRTP